MTIDIVVEVTASKELGLEEIITALMSDGCNIVLEDGSYEAN